MQIECFICHKAPVHCKHKQTLFIDREQSDPPYYLFVAQRGIMKDEYKGIVVDLEEDANVTDEGETRLSEVLINQYYPKIKRLPIDDYV